MIVRKEGSYPPCRRFKNVSSRPFFEKFRHFAAGTLAFDPVHDLGKLSAVEDEGKAPIPGVDTLPTLWVGSLCIHECPLLDVCPRHCYRSIGGVLFFDGAVG